eukprot:14994873-Ditylum_brightwellii.AAC.1
MMQEQRDHLDAKIILLLGSIKNLQATTEKNSNEIIAIQNQLGANLVATHNKHPTTEPADVMEDADALRCNRDA